MNSCTLKDINQLALIDRQTHPTKQLMARCTLLCFINQLMVCTISQLICSNLNYQHYSSDPYKYKKCERKNWSIVYWHFIYNLYYTVLFQFVLLGHYFKQITIRANKHHNTLYRLNQNRSQDNFWTEWDLRPAIFFKLYSLNTYLFMLNAFFDF